MIINVCTEIINVSSMSHRCLFNEQACSSDDNINESSMLAMCSRLARSRLELKSVHRRYLANRISIFALNLQSHWLIFASFGNLCQSFEV